MGDDDRHGDQARCDLDDTRDDPEQRVLSNGSSEALAGRMDTSWLAYNRLL